MIAAFLMLLAAADWLHYSGTYDGARCSELNQITPANVGRLKPEWVYQVGDLNPVEASPIVEGGVMYVSEPPSNATALDLRTGRPLWSYKRTMPADLRLCCGQVNRGLAKSGDTVFLGTLDAHLLALDARTGKIRWDVKVADYQTGYSINAAPLVVKDKVITGISGGEFGIRGFVDAYDVATGKRVWRFWTVPSAGEKGSETWAGDSAKTGSAGTWVTGSYDPALNLIYWATGNPGPDYNGSVRAGDNLYSNSMLALDADTGALKWHFQFTPHDEHDWDANHVPVLVDREWRGRQRKLLLNANRNGFFYALDRTNGEFLMGVPYARQTWAKGLDGKGRPVVIESSKPTVGGAVAYPGLHGATNWFSPTYSKATGLYYVAAREEGTSFYVGTPRYEPGSYYSAGGFRGIAGVEPSGAIRALDPETGKKVWEFPLHSPPWAGLLSTASGLVFGGASEGHFFALDARTGKPLWRFQTGGAVYSNPITYEFEGRQFITVAAGHAFFTFALERSQE